MTKSYLRSYLEANKVSESADNLTGVIATSLYVFYGKFGSFAYATSRGVTFSRGDKFLCLGECHIFRSLGVKKYTDACLNHGGWAIEINDFVFDLLIKGY